ncbi:MAG: ribosomal protein methyltransferase [Clostridia bacterium]|jgi:ribosomal protein L11 methyltransferase|nr:ribosomal protein methyltransferase [Clostridia bacterium]MDN5321760.1 ribosomal protein methyltransferase [Clostridia bacterium]
MNWLEVKVTTVQGAIEGIANIFHEMGAGGVVIEDPQLIAMYARRGEWDDHEFDNDLLETEAVVIKGYLPMDQYLLGKLEDIKQELLYLQVRLESIPIELDVAEVQEEDWANSWKAYFKPEKVGNKTVIKPSWEDYLPREGELIIELDPGMAFGTGNHATTALCIRLLEEYMKPGVEVFDVGTGSGVLSILAAKLGARSVQALDYDTVAVEAAQNNISKNNLKDVISVIHSDLLDKALGKADLIIANIVADIIIRLVPDIPDKLKREGIFICSGIIDERKKDVLEVLKKYAFDVIEVREDAGWVAIVARYSDQ